jgi:hypothetical protein
VTRAAALLLLMAPGIAAGACGPDGPAAASSAKFETGTPVFVFERGGRFLRGNLSSGEWKVISDRGFDYTPSVKASPDGRWISYSGNVRGRPATEYWLYDKRAGTERLYHQHPRWGLGMPAFSPDSKWLALYANYDSRWPSAEGEGLYVFELPSSRATFAGNPSKFKAPADQPFASATWAKDRVELLLMVRSMLKGGPDREYFSYLVAERRFERIEGRWGGSADVFSRAGAPLATALESRPQGSVRYRTAASPDDRWTAEVGADYVLKVRARDGVERRVASGTRDECRGVTIGINGWLDARHLVYSVGEQRRVFDTASGRDGTLYPAASPAVFLW